MGVGGGARDIIAVAFRHLLHILQGTDLLGDLLPQADHIVGHGAVAGIPVVPLLFLDQVVHAVKGHPAIVAHNAATAIGIGQTGDDVGVAGLLHLGGIGIKDRLVVGLVVVGEDLVQLGAGRVAIGGAGLLRHLNAAIGHEGTLQGLVGLQTHNLLQVLVGLADIAGAIGQRAGDHLRLHIQHAALGPLLELERLQIRPQGIGGIGGACQEALVPVVGEIVILDEFPDVDLIAPLGAMESVPGGGCLILKFCIHMLPPRKFWGSAAANDKNKEKVSPQ